MKKDDVGVVLYSIEMDGCLNGVYTNPTGNGDICNEINKRKIPDRLVGWPTSIEGIYACSWTEPGSKKTIYDIYNGELEIKTTPISNQYKFIWRDDKGIVCFVGMGFKMNERQIVVHYSVETTGSKYYDI